MKMLKTKHFRRIVVFLAMIAPAVYLFGSLFSALTGAHGTEVFAEPVYVDQWEEVDSYDGPDGYQYRLSVNDSVGDLLRSFPSTLTVNFDYSFSSGSNATLVDSNRVVFFVGSGSFRSLSLGDVIGDACYVSSDDVYGERLLRPWIFYSSELPKTFVDYFIPYSVISRLVSVPSSVVPENSGAYSDYIFKNFFAKDNFLEQIGKDVLSETPHGFAPFASFWKYLDNNMLHMGDMQLGLMGYGYVYYCCHVLLFDIAFIIVTFFLDFIQKVNDKVVGGVD